ncbi:MAG: DUF512 domain-containing protein [Ruminococcus sp.]|nr:DUF512 domain-containing protein [Ruminococcus sp.]
MSVKISAVTPHSAAERVGIKAGEELVSLNGNKIVDVLDYRFYQLETHLDVTVKGAEGERTVKATKTEYEELGLEFDTYLMDKERSCKNKCIFCFIDQLPKGMRETLYYKDDDSRLSFLFGNYITLTNLTEHEIERIIKMHISPVNISVHTTNPELRCKMMNNRFAGESLKIMEKFANAGLTLNCQLVICPGINDGDELKRSLNDLEKLSVNTIAVVPVGLTDHREGLYPLTPFNKETAEATLKIVENFSEKCLEKHGRRMAFAADELYIMAEREIPKAEFYEDFSCLENGVGLLSLLYDEFEFALEEKEADKGLVRNITLASGESAAPYLQKLFDTLKDKFPNVNINVVPIINDFFGHMINVTGLVVGRDLINTLKGKDLGDKLLFSTSMLRSDGDLFLDDTSVDDVRKALDIEVVPTPNDGAMLLDEILR